MGVDLKKISHQIIFLLLFPSLSGIFAFWSNGLLQQLLSMPWIFLVDSIGILGAYSLLYLIFDIYAWQFLPQGFFGIVEVPNLNGTWSGQLRTSYDRNEATFQMRVEVVQTFSSIKINSYFHRSWSYSIIADFYKEPDDRHVLHYIYKNEPYESAASTMHGHYGACKHEYIKQSGLMKCSYYNEPPRCRGWYGSFTVKRKKRTIYNYLFPWARMYSRN